MASVRRMSPEPTLPQVRDYVLTMLEGLSRLAETVDDRHTRDRVRDFAHDLLMSWSAAPDATDPGPAARASAGQGDEGRPEGAVGGRLIVRKRP